MRKDILEFYKNYSQFTYPGLYEDYLKTLPDDISELGYLVRMQLIHRTTFAAGNVGSNADKKYGDMTKVPWFRQAEDDYFPTSAAMLAELFRRDPKGLTLERKVEDKLVLTCRYITLLVSSILKTKGIPTRVRSGFASYFPNSKGKSWDHWVNQYWSKKEKRWATIDVDGSLHNTGFDMYQIPKDTFDYPAIAWLAVRRGKVDQDHFWNAHPKSGLVVVSWELFRDFHCLMNDEIIYLHSPKYYFNLQKFYTLSEEELKEIDNLATLMLTPDENFDKLTYLFETEKKYRILKGGLL